MKVDRRLQDSGVVAKEVTRSSDFLSFLSSLLAGVFALVAGECQVTLD